MAPKAKKRRLPSSDPGGMFAGMVVFPVENGVQPRRLLVLPLLSSPVTLAIWKQKLEQMGASIEDRLSKKVTHVFAMNSGALLKQIGRERVSRFGGSVLLYKWLEDSLSLGKKVSEAPYILMLESGGEAASNKSSEESGSKAANEDNSSDEGILHYKRDRLSPEEHKIASSKNKDKAVNRDACDTWKTVSGSDDLSSPMGSVTSSPTTSDALSKTVGTSDSSLPYNPPDQNQNITKIFGKLMNIYRALGDDRRSFSYNKAIAVIEKLPFKIDTVDQVKHLPTIGKSMQDHIQEIVRTGKLSKLEHFETDEKVRTISLFGEVWGIGPATALKLYEKGHRSLDDLKNESSLTNSQRVRLLAESKGYRLDDTGLFPATKGSSSKPKEMASAIMSMFPLSFKPSSLPSSLPSNPSLSLFCNSSSSTSSSSSSSSSSSGGFWVLAYISYRDDAHFRRGNTIKRPNVLPLLVKNRRSPYPSGPCSSSTFTGLICRATEYQFPDPIPEFADAETEKFRNHLFEKLSKKDLFGDSLEEVVGICTEIFSTFLHTEYGGPGTLLVIPFIDMADTLNEQGLPGGPQAARAAVKWAQKHVDKDWKEWGNQ
ncbi:DNA-directed DNA polymerase [Sarracenia purpurea var. burkii]